MFTGLIQTVGTLKQITKRGNYRVLNIQSSLASENLEIGESISCDGACLTVTAFDNSSFDVEASHESVAKTVISGYRGGSLINLERALQVGQRMGGHMVSGHIDDTGRVDYLKRIGQSWELAVSFDAEFDNFVINKGSVAINGVSLTINEIKSGWLTVNIIPHTISETTLGRVKKKDSVNLEFDLIGKYISKMIHSENKNSLTIEKLRESGW